MTNLCLDFSTLILSIVLERSGSPCLSLEESVRVISSMYSFQADTETH